jgi:uncharacterized repeat protein (TIGR01451 family)
MHASFRHVLTLAAAGWLAATAAIAQAPDVAVEVDVAREVVHVREDGSRSVGLERVDVTRPGDVLVYTVRATNVGDAPALAPRVDDPIPTGTVLIVDSVDRAGPRPHASLDGGTTWTPFPAFATRVREDGTTVQVPAPPEAYTHLRWVWDGPLPPGASADLTFKVRVL